MSGGTAHTSWTGDNPWINGTSNIGNARNLICFMLFADNVSVNQLKISHSNGHINKLNTIIN
jgi:hypothetical protein